MVWERGEGLVQVLYLNTVSTTKNKVSNRQRAHQPIRRFIKSSADPKCIRVMHLSQI